MKIREIHSWDIDYTQARALQDELRERLTTQGFNFPPRLVASADVSYSRLNNTTFAAVVVFDFPKLEQIETVTATGVVNFPYIPGLLTFREAPVMLAAFQKLESLPDVVIFDGQGIAHPRGLGLATHMGLWIDIATIGCAKSRLVGEYAEVGPEVGDRAELRLEGRTIGYVLRTKRNVKPVFVSPGNRIELEQSVEIVLRTTRGYRLPEPIRQAHITVNQSRLQFQSNHG